MVETVQCFGHPSANPSMNVFDQTLIVPPHICYVVFDGAGQIVNHSPTASLDHWRDISVPLLHTDIRDHFPELYGCEDVFMAIAVNEMPHFALNGITRTTADGQNLYLDLHVQATPSTAAADPYLILFIENVSEKMHLEQVLVQSTNESNLLLNALTASKNYIDRIVTAIADALIVTTPDQTIKTINHATEILFGYTQAELIDQPLSRLILNADPLFAELAAAIQTEGVLSRNIEVECQTKQGAKLNVAFSCSLIQTEAQGESDHRLTQDIVYIGRDITERHRTQQRLAAQYAIARILSESISLEVATHRILQAIGENLNWDVGEFWIPYTTDERKPIAQDLEHTTWDQDGNPCPAPVPRLQRVDFWAESSPNTSFQSFLQGRVLVDNAEGIGFVGRVWSAGRPQWITTLQTDPDFGAQSLIVQSGLNTALAFPLQSGSEMLGVMTFFRREHLPPDHNLLQMMGATGNQLGQFIKRKEAEIALHQQQEKTEHLLLSILPQAIAERLKAQITTIADSFEEVTVLFADLVGFTQLAANLPPIELVEQLNVIFSEFDALSAKYGVEKIKTIGDAYMMVAGLPTPRGDHVEVIATVALEMQTIIKRINQTTPKHFDLRIGMNTGSVVAGVIGTTKFSYDLWGDTVNIASRMESQGLPGHIQVTETIYHRLKNQYILSPRGVIPIKGKGQMNTYLLHDHRPPANSEPA